MNGPEFFQTLMGRRFYEGDVPRVAQALERIAISLEALERTAIRLEALARIAAGLEKRADQSGEVHSPFTHICRRCGAECSEHEGDFYGPGLEFVCFVCHKHGEE
jgi:hypothetical protein